MRCEELMKRDVECVSPNDTVEAAARRMRDRNVGFLPICDASMKIVGAVTDRDLTVRVLADGRPGSTPLSDVLTRQIIVVKADDDLEVAKEQMAKHHKSRIMCVDGNGRLAGVISLSDIAQRGDGSQTLREVARREARF